MKYKIIFYQINGEKGGFSPKFEILSPILDILDPLKLDRIKANLITITPKIVKNQFHVDFGSFAARHVSENMKKWTTSIFYVNTNDGYTEFEDGTIVDIVEHLVQMKK